MRYYSNYLLQVMKQYYERFHTPKERKQQELDRLEAVYNLHDDDLANQILVDILDSD